MRVPEGAFESRIKQLILNDRRRKMKICSDLQVIGGGVVDELDSPDYGIVFNTYRMKVPGGWLVYRDSLGGDHNGDAHPLHCHSTVAFVADANHEWKVVEPDDDFVRDSERESE